MSNISEGSQKLINSKNKRKTVENWKAAQGGSLITVGWLYTVRRFKQ